MLSSLSVCRRWAAISLIGTLAAGCSTTGSPSAGPALGVAQPGARRTAADYRTLADGHGARFSATGSSSSGWLSPDLRRKKRRSIIYWGNYDKNTIAIFLARGVNGRQIGQITTGLSNPERLFVDTQRSVYATNIGNNTITGYLHGQTTPFLTISNGVSSPTGLTVDAAGTVYCANVGNDTITVYPRGKTSPSLTIPVPSVPEYLATDASDNLYASVGSEVMEFAPGSTNGKNLGLSASSPSALEVDRAGNLIVLDGSTIDYFPAGQTQPSKQISVSSGFPFALSLSADEKTLYVSVDDNSGNFIIQDVSYPSGTSLANKLTTTSGEWPLAVSPDNALGS